MCIVGWSLVVYISEFNYTSSLTSYLLFGDCWTQIKLLQYSFFLVKWFSHVLLLLRRLFLVYSILVVALWCIRVLSDRIRPILIDLVSWINDCHCFYRKYKEKGDVGWLPMIEKTMHQRINEVNVLKLYSSQSRFP